MPTTHTQTDSQAQIQGLLDLTDALLKELGDLIKGSPLDGLGPIEISRKLRMAKSFTSTLMSVLRMESSVHRMMALPGTAPLLRFIKAARNNGADSEIAKNAEKKVKAFELRVQEIFGTRMHMQAAIADASPETSTRQQMRARQAVFSGQSLLKGVSIDLAMTTVVVHPNREHADKIDTLSISGYTGIRRLRPSARICFLSHVQPSGVAPEGWGPLFPAHLRKGTALMQEFCSPSTLDVLVTHKDLITVYEVASGSVQRDAVSNVFLAEYHGGQCPRSEPPTGHIYQYGVIVEQPYKRLVLDLIFPKDLWTGCDFYLLAYDTCARGPAKPLDPNRESDIIDVAEPLQKLEFSSETASASPLPDYERVITEATKPLGWDLSGFRLFRCEVVYPQYGMQLSMVYQPPQSGSKAKSSR